MHFCLKKMKKMKNSLYKLLEITFLLSIMLPTSALASWDTCFETAGLYYGIDPTLLKAIAIKESDMKSDAFNENRGINGSYDVGVMQINSAHHKKLEDDYSLSLDNIKQPCQNIVLGAWILAHCINVFGNNWEAVGCYNAGTAKSKRQKEKRSSYAEKVIVIYERISIADNRVQQYTWRVP